MAACIPLLQLVVPTNHNRSMHLQLVKALEDTARAGGPTLPGVRGHDVQLYSTDVHLTATVADFLAAGVRMGQPVVVIATEAHRRAFQEELRARGLDMDALMSDRDGIWLDARTTLSAFMEGRLPDREMFMATVGNVFEQVLKKRYYLIVRGYGEMVDLLWKDGNTEGALQVEALWNELADKYAYSLLCGYAMDNFLCEAGVEGFRRVCEQHTHALPFEKRLNESA